jgi:prephenate dehydratase
VADAVDPGAAVAFLGPSGTFTEEALRTQPDLTAARLVPMKSFVDVLAAVESGGAGYGFVALENSIEGTVAVAMDQLVFERDLFILREVTLAVTQNLLAPAGTRLDDVKAVVSFPHATGQCRRWLTENLPGVEEVASTSTAAAVRQVAADRRPGTAAIGTALAASIYDLDVLAPRIEDHADNSTRFVLVGPPSAGVPAPTGHDKTSIVCFQSTDRPGSLHAILGQFSARAINLTKLESRPTRKALGDYCFVIDMAGHVADEVVADCLRDLHATLPMVKFLGSYPAAGAAGAGIRRDARAAWAAADRWVGDIRSRVRPRPPAAPGGS